MSYGSFLLPREAFNSFVNMDKLIDYVNGNKSLGVNVRYAFLSDYVNAVHALNINWPVFEVDLSFRIDIYIRQNVPYFLVVLINWFHSHMK